MLGLWRWAAGVLCALSATLWLVSPAGAGAATVPGGALRAVMSRARASSPVPAARRLNVTVALKPRDPAALTAYAQAVSTPGRAAYHAYLTPGQFARRFGPTRAQIASVQHFLRSRGLHPGNVSPGGLSIPLHATATALEHGFSVPLRELTFAGRRKAIAATASPRVGADVAGIVQSIVGLNGVPVPRPLLARPSAVGASSPLTPGPRSPLARAHVVTGGPQPCMTAQGSAPSQDAYTTDQIASAYGFSGLYGAGDKGAGVTVAVYELEPNDPADIAAYQSCYGTHASVSYIRVDGGAGSGAGSGEAAIDIENTIGLAPSVNVLVYQGPNQSANGPGSGPFDTFRDIIDQDRAQVVSVSWGDCEAAIGGQTNAIVENDLFEQAAVQGQTIVAASGDSGSEDCDAGGPVPDTSLAVDDPASQPFVTGVGGTTLANLGPRPTESVWNSGGSLAAGLTAPGAGGGGSSEYWAMPAAQLGAAPALGVGSAGSGSGCGSSRCRAVPDVAADADPSTGYLVYWNGSGSETGQPSGWQGFGGTSAGTPVWGALFALADASKACQGLPVGYANPALYRAAGSAYAGDFNDITSGNNDFTGTNGGRFAATPGYDEASGLGTPNAASLAPALCANTVRLQAVGTQHSAAHSTVSLQLRGHDSPATKINYQTVTPAAGPALPPGLRLNGSTGKITGKLQRTGSFTVRLIAQDGAGSVATGAFTWVIGAASRLSRVSLNRSAGKLAFTVTTGKGAPALSTLRITVPHGLRLASHRGVGITATAGKSRRVRFTASVRRGAETIKLRRAVAGVRVVLRRPGLQDPRHRRTRRSRLGVSVTYAGAGTSSLSAAVR
ncbi:MAG: protease pro-enzyme activation domain-containing protein [Solirubrobacteraceae bacterium]